MDGSVGQADRIPHGRTARPTDRQADRQKTANRTPADRQANTVGRPDSQPPYIQTADQTTGRQVVRRSERWADGPTADGQTDRPAGRQLVHLAGE